MKTICIITGSRAEYSLLRGLMRLIKDDKSLKLQVIVTGMHLSPEFGLTYQEIEGDGFKINRKVEMLVSSDTPVGIAKSMGLGLIGFADALQELQPDLIVVLGDRFEIFSAVSAALVANIPIAHLHGGEVTEGSVDEAFRHSITKMSHLHFVATKDYADRVIQLGEQPEHVFLVGGLGVDNIKSLKILDRDKLQKLLGFEMGKKNLLVTFHPPTSELVDACRQMKCLLEALTDLDDTQLIFTLPNADAGGRALIDMVRKFEKDHSNAHVYTSLGQLLYFSCVAQVDGVVGNSSSGFTEVPSFRKGVINIGSRQKGRITSDCIINCEPDYESISAALKKLYSDKFQASLKDITNPYGQGGASKKIVNIIKQHSLNGIVQKTFYDLSH